MSDENDELSELDPFEDSLSDSYFLNQQKVFQAQISSLKADRTENPILQTLRNNVQRETTMVEDYNNQVQELQGIVGDSIPRQLNPLILAQESLTVAPSLPSPTLTANHSLHIKQQEQKLSQKILSANIDREVLAMSIEDEISMKIEIHCQMKIFRRERLLTIPVPRQRQQDSKIARPITRILNSFTNLKVTPVTEQTVLPKNAPEIALRNLSLRKRTPLLKIGNTVIKINPEQVNFDEKQKQKEQKKGQSKSLNVQIKEALNRQMQEVICRLSEIRSTSKSYNPRFLKMHLSETEKSVAPEIVLSQDYKDVSSYRDLQNCGSLRSLRLTFQNLTSLNGIGNLPSLESLSLQFNCLSSVRELAGCHDLIELDISHNKVSSLREVSLPRLKFINAQSNELNSLCFSGGNLEIGLFGHNAIAGRLQLSPNKYLRVLKMGWNKLQLLQGLKGLHFLEILQANDNFLREVQITDCFFLKELRLDSNKIKQLPVLTKLYLTKLDLSRNYLSSLQQMVLPCLQTLSLDRNSLKSPATVPHYLPNLISLTVQQNALQGVAFLLSLLRYSKHLRSIAYERNDYFINLREKAREFYQHIFVKYFSQLQHINGVPIEIGLKKYYEHNFLVYLKDEFFKQDSFTDLRQKMRFTLSEGQACEWIQKHSKRFAETLIFIEQKMVKKVVNFESILQSLSKESIKPCVLTDSIFCYHDAHELKRRKSMHLIRSLLIGRRYRKQRRIRIYLRRMDQIVTKCAHIKSIVDDYRVRQATSILKQANGQGQKQKAAVVIQKYWRGMACRRRYKAILLKLHRKEDDMDIEEIDVAFCDEDLVIPDLDFDFGDMVLDHLIIRPEVFTMLQKKTQASKPVPRLEAAQSPPKRNNFIIEEVAEEEKEDEVGRVMREWGFKDRSTAEAMIRKMKKKDSWKKKVQEENMTAAERFQRFKQKH